jgi:hypothetical protein
MKKFNVAIAGVAREVNANEYSVSPKTGVFDAQVFDGGTTQAWTTSGKGKSAINNHYIYFKDGDQLFYFKSNAVEVVEARKGMVIGTPLALVAQAQAETAGAPSEPAPKRTRRAK